MTTGKTIALTRWTFVGKVMSLLFNMLSRLVITFLPRSKIVQKRQPNLKNRQGTWIDISPEKIYNKPKCTWEMLNIINHLGNAHENHEILLHTSRVSIIINIHKITWIGEIETLIHCWLESTIVQFGSKIAWQFLKKLNMELPYPQISFLGTKQENWKHMFTQKPVHECSEHYYSWQSKSGNNLSVQQLMNG